jgi:hypothetical protein
MKTYAVISNGVVLNIIVAESQEIAEQCNPHSICVEYTLENPANIGWTYDGSTFIEPTNE